MGYLLTLDEKPTYLCTLLLHTEVEAEINLTLSFPISISISAKPTNKEGKLIHQAKIPTLRKTSGRTEPNQTVINQGIIAWVERPPIQVLPVFSTHTRAFSLSHTLSRSLPLVGHASRMIEPPSLQETYPRINKALFL